MNLSSHRTLILNSTFQPLSVVSFKRAISLMHNKKINAIRKYFSSIGRDEDYDESLKTLSSAKIEVNEFFDNVIVNDQEELIKKNRLELLKMLCKSFDNYFNFSKIEA